MKYGEKIIRMEGVLTDIEDGGVSIDLKGRLGRLQVPMRMVISDYPLEVGQTMAWNMSFVEQEGPEVNEKYVSNLDVRNTRRAAWLAQQEAEQANENKTNEEE